jgi:hypothetical protein
MDRQLCHKGRKQLNSVELAHADKYVYSYRSDYIHQASKEATMRRVREDWKSMGSSAHVSNVQHDSVLRQFAEPSRNKARARDWSSSNCVRRTW